MWEYILVYRLWVWLNNICLLYYILQSLSGLFSTTTSSSDLLTPTTLANLEQTLIDFQVGAPATTNLPRESGFVPPVINPGPSTSSTMVKQEYPEYLYDDDSSSQDVDDWYSPGEKRQRFDSPGITMQPSYGDVSQNTPSTTPNRRRRLDDNNVRTNIYWIKANTSGWMHAIDQNNNRLKNSQTLMQT